MANIQLTDRFKTILEKDQEIDAIVKLTLSRFGEILKKDNKLYFFKEYTDHGIEHIEKVIFSSDNLITAETFKNILTPYDIGYYILSVILHDIGMHIDLAGFNSLINKEYDFIRIEMLDKQTWSELWEDYLNEAKKFNGKQLKSIFGNENAVIRIPPTSESLEMNEQDKMLIGEFIRRHHARLAHEIAIHGFPGKLEKLPFAEGLSDKIKSMIGLISRSHGMDLRKCMDYIESTYGKNGRVVPNKTHAIYLMTLLRLADYIQIDSSRSSKTLIKIKRFSSPISQMEHDAHLSIEDIDNKYQADPERIFVTTSPNDSSMFLKLKKLISDIQYQFDISWAVLGELYGNILDKPQLKYRRITSNLEDERFITEQNYIADNFSFKANDEISKLLIAPLYGDDPKFGIRELLQNAIDACKERENLERKIGTISSYTSLITIDVSSSDQANYFIIHDNGMGMDIDVIKNYFLSAGASYRKSLEWLKQFINEKGKSTVRRNGRFGIGILAAFLIRNEIYVETRKKGSKYGYKFSADLNTDQINVLKDENIQFGTAIKINITKEMLNALKPKVKQAYETDIDWYEWYVFSEPKIVYKYLNDEIKATKKTDPDLDDDLPEDWNAIDSSGFNKILWTYNKKYSKTDISCNGIVIPNRNFKYNIREFLNLGLLNNAPYVNVFDNNAYLPLSLSRNDFTRRLPFEKDLLEDVYKDFISSLFAFDKPSIVNENNITINSPYLLHPGLRYYDYFAHRYGINSFLVNKKIEKGHVTNVDDVMGYVLSNKKGFIINYNYFINKLGKINSILINAPGITSLQSFDLNLGDNFFVLTKPKINSIADFRSAIEPSMYNHDTNSIESINANIFIKKINFNYIFDTTVYRLPRSVKELFKITHIADNWTLLKLNSPNTSIISKDFLEKYSTRIDFIREYEITCPYQGDPILDDLLQRYIGDDVVIPYSIDDRRKKFPLAFKELERYMRKYL